jgi:F-type H+-transporting ATPase subunit a
VRRHEVAAGGACAIANANGTHYSRISPAGWAGRSRAAGMTIDPIDQFNIDNLFKIGQIGKQPIFFTNSSIYMLVSVAVICLLMISGVSGRQLVPGRFQSMAEVTYEFVAGMVRSVAGREGMKFFPLVFSLFMFILVSNVIGIIPCTFTVSSHIIVTATLALLAKSQSPQRVVSAA